MDLRITPQAQMRRQMSYLRKQTDALARYQEQASTGIKLNRPSDNPLDMVALLSARSEDLRLDTHQANLAGARNQLEQGNSALLESSKLFTRARQLALEGANGTSEKSTYDALALEVDRLLEQFLTTANTSVDGRYVFGGTANEQPPFTVTSLGPDNRPLTIGYRGSDSRSSVPVGRNQQIDVLYQGDRIFMKSGADAFQALIGLRDELRNTTGMTESQQAQALTQRVKTLEDAQSSILTSVGELSSNLEAIESLDARLGDLQVQIKSRMGDLESADMADVIVHLRTQETLFGATLQISAKLFDQTLMDYLR